jgi:hypothetical protein
VNRWEHFRRICRQPRSLPLLPLLPAGRGSGRGSWTRADELSEKLFPNAITFPPKICTFVETIHLSFFIISKKSITLYCMSDFCITHFSPF